MAISPQRLTIYLYSAHRARGHLCDSTAFLSIFIFKREYLDNGSRYG